MRKQANYSRWRNSDIADTAIEEYHSIAYLCE